MPSVFTDPGGAYFERRSLRRHARVLELWALGVGAVISGDFFGWNFGLTEGGFGGMLLALVVMTILFAGLCFSHRRDVRGASACGRSLLIRPNRHGAWGGYITGLAENMEYILTPAVIVVGVGGYLGAVFRNARRNARRCGGSAAISFSSLSMWPEWSCRSVCRWWSRSARLAILVVFFVGAAPHFDLHKWALGETGWLPHGTMGAWRALPFALWVYLGIEQFPLAAEESHDPARDMPKGMLLGLATLILFAFLTVILNAGIAPGTSEVGRSDEPLFLAFQTIVGDNTAARGLALIGCAGLIASFHAIIFAYGRQIYSLSRAGYFPAWLSVTHGTRQTPGRALIAGSILGYLAALAFISPVRRAA